MRIVKFKSQFILKKFFALNMNFEKKIHTLLILSIINNQKISKMQLKMVFNRAPKNRKNHPFTANSKGKSGSNKKMV